MYTDKQLKQIYKQATKIKNSLERSMASCSKTIYTEQNTEELNAVKNFISYKLDIINEIIMYVKNALNKFYILSKEDLSSELGLYQKQFNQISSDPYLSRLEKIYTRNLNVENFTL